MWHTTDQTPREGAEIVATKYARAARGIYGEGCIDDSRPISPLLSDFDHWAYAPGEAE